MHVHDCLNDLILSSQFFELIFYNLIFDFLRRAITDSNKLFSVQFSKNLTKKLQLTLKQLAT